VGLSPICAVLAVRTAQTVASIPMRISVVNVKGGVGKTTTAVYLAALAAEAGPVVLVDADPQASAAEWLEEASVPGVQVVEAPSERLVTRAAELAGDCTLIIDTPPGAERLVRAAIASSDAVVIPTRAGGVEVSRVQATLGMLPPGRPHGLVLIAGRPNTRDYRDTVAGWVEAGVPVWASIPERVGIAAGPEGPLHPDGLAAYRGVLDAVASARSL
jgi:chromosome partitioning protein